VLTGLRSYPDLEIRSIVTMIDAGGDSGRLRDEFGVLPPGDLRRCLVALSDESALLRDLFSFRFSEAPLAGRSFGTAGSTWRRGRGRTRRPSRRSKPATSSCWPLAISTARRSRTCWWKAFPRR
jgi:hypothetical protein